MLIQAYDICKTYADSGKSVHALRKVNLCVEKRGSLAIMGPSGSGKSTLLHILGCLDRPTGGSYYLNNKNISLLSDRELSHIRASQIGFVFQSFNLIPQFTLLDNVTMPFMYQRKGTPNAQKMAAAAALEKVGLLHRLHHKPNELSGGEIQRAAIARALVINPLLILADEPTGNLDSATASEILSLFNTLHSQGTTLIIVTHNKDVASVCQRSVWMYDGELESDTSIVK